MMGHFANKDMQSFPGVCSYEVKYALRIWFAMLNVEPEQRYYITSKQ